MSRSNWLYDFALRGWLIAAVTCLLASSALGQDQQPKTEPKGTESETQQQQPVKPALAPKEHKHAPQEQTLCDKAKPGPESDLCQQWRMAKAAEKQVYWTRKQYTATLWEIGALVATIFVAMAAVGAAFMANIIARKSAERQLRAYMSLVPAGIHYYPPNHILRIYAKQDNSGQTPARKARFSGFAKILPYPLPDKFEFPSPIFGEGVNVVGARQNFLVWARLKESFFESEAPKLNENNERLYFIGVLEYEDIFGQPHETLACWSYSGDAVLEAIKEFQTRGRQADDAQIREPMGMGFDYTTRHNDAD